MATFNFCPSSMVPVTLPPEVGTGFTSNTGWNFTARPTAPYQRRFKLKLYGMKWVLNDATGRYDATEAPQFNARALEIFYAQHQTWLPFTFNHPHLGPMTCRFAAPVQVPEGMENSGGQIDMVEVTLIEHNPGYGTW